MLRTESPDLHKLITEHFAAFGREPPDGALSAYWDALKKKKLPDVKSALAMHVARKKKFPAAATEILELVDEMASADATGKSQQCSYGNNGKRCPFRGFMWGKGEAPVCPGHHELRAFAAGAAAYLDAALNNQVRYTPGAGDVLVARHMEQFGNGKAIAPIYGERMVQFLRDNPKLQLENRPWPILADARDEAQRIAESVKQNGIGMPPAEAYANDPEAQRA